MEENIKNKLQSATFERLIDHLRNRKDVYEELLYLRNQGRINRGTFVHPKIGYNFRMSDIQMAIGLTQLEKFDTIVERKNKSFSSKYFMDQTIENFKKEF